MLESPEEVTAFHYNPVNVDVVAAGCLSGQVALWDIALDDVSICELNANSSVFFALSALLHVPLCLS